MAPMSGKPAPSVLPIDPDNPVALAMRVLGAEHSLAMLSQQVSQGLGNLQSTMCSLQGDVRETSNKVGELAATQHEIQSHSTGLERLANSIDGFVKENVEWRRTHESENRGVADAVTSAKGGVRALAWFGICAMGLVVFTVQMQFQTAAADRSRIELAHDRDLARVEARMVKMDAEREELQKLRGLK